MSQPYVGEIRMFAGNFAPVGWNLCQGQLLAISQNAALFNLIGTTYGGDGITTFALPNLQSRVPVHQANGFSVGQSAGEETVTLTVSQIPSHSHVPQANSKAGTANGPGSNVWASSATANQFSTAAPNVANTLAANAVASAGSSQPHDNMVPFLVINFIISMFGIFPTQN
jgi:microcystin-dependent protein